MQEFTDQLCSGHIIHKYSVLPYSNQAEREYLYRISCHELLNQRRDNPRSASVLSLSQEELYILAAAHH